MHARQFPSRFLIALLSLGLLALASAAGAAGDKDKEAAKAMSSAMDEDYLATEFGKAETKLKDAVKKCGTGCSPETLGKLHVALGTVYGVGMSKMGPAKDEFVAALKADPNAALDPNLTTPELVKTFAEAKKGGGSAPTPPDSGDEKPSKAKPGGDFAHTPPAEQAVNTPVPIFVEIPDDVGADKVTLHYKPFGGSKWKTVEMTKVGKGWGAEIPCDDVTTTGDVKYFIVAKDTGGEPAGTSGSMKEPYTVPIKNEIEGAAPSLPGKKPPVQCKAKEDCPPGLPGCPDAKGGKHGDKGWGASCDQSDECQENLACLNGTCEESKGGDEGDGNKTKGKTKKNLIGAWGELDLLFLSGSQNVCNGSNPAYQCYYTGADAVTANNIGNTGGQYPSNAHFGPRAETGSNTDGIQGGLGVGGGRVLLSYDRVLAGAKTPADSLGQRITAGVRAGYAFGGQPSGFRPFDLEVRGTYSVLGPLLELKKIRPYVLVGGGLAEIDASVQVSICDTGDPTGHAIATAKPNCPRTGTASVPRSLNAYQITGLGFIDFGGGAVYGITDNFGIAAELKAMFLVPTFGFALAPSIGPVFGF